MTENKNTVSIIDVSDLECSGNARCISGTVTRIVDGDTIYVDDRTIDSHIKRLRKKFRLHDPNFDQIRTRYGSGYSWRE